MKAEDLKTLAETFRANASNKNATTQAADAALAAHPDDDDVKQLVADLKSAKNRDEVLAVLDAVPDA